jgi:hypothetical protein
VIWGLGASSVGALRLRVERSGARRRGGDREDEFPGFGGDGDAGAGGEAVLLEPAAGEAEVWDGGFTAPGAAARAEEGGDAQFAGFAGAASVAGAVRGRSGCGVAGGAHGGGPSAGKLRVFGVGPGEGGGEAGDGGGELGGFGARDGVELAGEGVADGGLLLLGFVWSMAMWWRGRRTRSSAVRIACGRMVSASGPRASSMRSRGQVSRALDISSSRQNHLPRGVVISSTSPEAMAEVISARVQPRRSVA